MTMQDNNLPLPRRSFMQSLALASAGLYLGSTSVFGQDQRLATPGATVATSYGQVRGLLRDGIQHPGPECRITLSSASAAIRPQAQASRHRLYSP